MDLLLAIGALLRSLLGVVGTSTDSDGRHWPNSIVTVWPVNIEGVPRYEAPTALVSRKFNVPERVALGLILAAAAVEGSGIRVSWMSVKGGGGLRVDDAGNPVATIRLASTGSARGPVVQFEGNAAPAALPELV